MVVFTKMLFHVDNGGGEGLSGTGLACEYSFTKRKLVWRKIGTAQMQNQMSLAYKILTFSPVGSPLLILPFLYFLKKGSTGILTPFERFGAAAFYAPMILGFLFFISFEALMVYIRDTYPLIDPPEKEQQIKHLQEISNYMKYIETFVQVKTPYLSTALAPVGIIFIAIPITIWVYFQESNLNEALAQLLVLGFMLSLIPTIIWCVLLRILILNRELNKLKKEMKG